MGISTTRARRVAELGVEEEARQFAANHPPRRPYVKHRSVEDRLLGEDFNPEK
jgi:hypothetical protein